MDYPHWLRITRAAAAAETPAGTPAVVVNRRTGGWTRQVVPGGSPAGAPAGHVVVWEGPADVQDRGRTMERNEAGAPTARSDGTAYLMEPAGLRAMDLVEDDDLATVFWRRRGYGPDLMGPTDDARVAKVTRLDTSLELLRL